MCFWFFFFFWSDIFVNVDGVILFSDLLTSCEFSMINYIDFNLEATSDECDDDDDFIKFSVSTVVWWLILRYVTTIEVIKIRGNCFSGALIKPNLIN